MSTFFKTSWRNLTKDRLSSLLNIVGLAISLSVSILILIFIIQENTFDKTSKSERTFRFISIFKNDGETLAGIPSAVSPAIKAEMPEIELSARSFKNDFGQSATIDFNGNNFTEDKLYWVDKDLLEIFELKFLHGDRKTALDDPESMIISETVAKKYFGDENPVGKSLKLNREYLYKITGVYKDLPFTSTFDANIIGSFANTWFYKNNLTWDNNSFETWFVLKNKADIVKINNYLPGFLNKHKEENQYYSLTTQPLSEVHLHSSHISEYSQRAGSQAKVDLMRNLAFILLAIAAINYINLTTAKAQQRAKTIGINKTLGAKRRTLIGQIYTETFLLTLISILIAITLTIICIPLFNALTNTSLQYSTLAHPLFYLGIPIIWISFSLIAGFYPAWVLTSYKPITTVQKQHEIKGGKNILRQVLVTSQFVVCTTLIVAVLVIQKQMDFLGQQKLGYNTENVMTVQLNALKSQKEIDALTNSFKQLSTTLAVSSSQALIGKGESGNTIKRDETEEQGLSVHTNLVKEGIEDVLGLKLLAGRMVKNRGANDTIVEMVVNKYIIEYLGISEGEAIGKRLDFGQGYHSYIVGVVDNFNIESLHKPISGYLFHNGYGPIRNLLIRFKTGNLSETINQYQKTYSSHISDAPFSYDFLDSFLKSQYNAEQRMASTTVLFAVLAIIVGCLGLFGLVSFTAEKRAKEISIRKILGASMSSISRLLGFSFIKLILISLLIAIPLSYWVMNYWLNGFYYRIKIDWLDFGIAGLTCISIAALTISYQTIKTAVVNPVTNLRDE